MGIEFSLTADGIGAVYTSSGVLTSRDLVEASSRLRVEITQQPQLRYLLVDHSAIPEEKLDTASLRALADEVGERIMLLSEGLVAIVAPSDVLFGLSRLWEALAEQPRLVTLVTRTRAEAIGWLREELSKRQLPFSLT